MDLFRKAKSVRLITHNDRYLTAEEDQQTVTHTSREGSSSTLWMVEIVEDENESIRLRSCHGTYLTASSTPFLPRVTGKRVNQTAPSYCDPSTKWQPLRDGMQVRLKSFWGNYLRPNGGLPPWRGSVTHDVPHRPKTRDKLLWDVKVIEKSTPYKPRASESDKNENKFGRTRSRSFSASMNFKKDGIFTATSHVPKKSMISY